MMLKLSLFNDHFHVAAGSQKTPRSIEIQSPHSMRFQLAARLAW